MLPVVEQRLSLGFASATLSQHFSGRPQRRNPGTMTRSGPWKTRTPSPLVSPLYPFAKKYPLEDVEKEFQKSRDAAIQKKQSTWRGKEKLNQLPQFVRNWDMKHPYLSDTVTEPALGKRRTTNRGTNEKPRQKKPRRALNGNMSDSESSERDSCASSLGTSEGEEDEEGDDQLLQLEGDDGGEEEEDEEESNMDSNAPEADAVLLPHHLARSPAPSNTSTDESPAEVPPPPVAAPPTAEAVLLQAIKEATDNSGKISSSSEWISRLFELLGVSTGKFLEQSGRPAPADFVGLLEQTVKTLAEWSSLAGQDDGDMAASINRVVDATALLPSKASAEVNVGPTTEQIRMLEADVESTSDPDRAKLRRIKAEEKDMEVCMKITGLLSAQRERVDRLDEMITERQDCRHTVVVPAIPGGSEVAREACTRANAKVAKLAEELERVTQLPCTMVHARTILEPVMFPRIPLRRHSFFYCA